MTNATTSVGYFAYKVYVYDEHVQDVTMPINTATNITVQNANSKTGVWGAKSTSPGIAAVSLNTASAANRVTATITAGASRGTTTISVTNDFHIETINVTVTKPTVTLETFDVYVGEDVVIPAELFGGAAWFSARSGDTLLATLPATSGEAGTGVTVHGVAPGLPLITFETADTIYQVHVRVTAKSQVDLGTIQVKEGTTHVLTDSRIAGDWRNAVSANPAKVTIEGASTGSAGTGPTVRGDAETSEGETVAVTFEDATSIYTAHVQVVGKYHYDGGIKTVVPPPMDNLPSTVADTTNYEAPAFIPADPAWGENYTVQIVDENVATNVVTAEGIWVYGKPQGKRGDVGVTQDNGAKTTLTVTTDDAVYTYTIYVVSDETHVVHFCEGDKTQIWYNDTTDSDVWFLLINDNRYELDQRGEGNQMHVTLHAQDDHISYIIATADTVGDPEHGDLVVISDGHKYYAYRMSCSPARVVAVGDSTNMICRTVAINPWRVDYMSDQWGYTNYIDVVCDHNTDETASHFTEATITGRAIAGETYVLVRDDQHKAAEHNAQGAVYTLKTRVVGCPVIPVQISPGASADVAWENWADPEAEMTIEITGAGADVYHAQFVDGVNRGDSFVMNLSADENATYGQSATITVKAGGVALARYTCSIMPAFAVKEGTVAPGYLYGVDATPWVSSSSNPSVITVTPTKYNRMYSAEAKFLQEGWAELHSTNAYYQAGYFFIRATVYDTHVTDLDMDANSVSNVVVTHNGTFAGEWTYSVDAPDLIDSVTLTPDPNDPMKVTAAISAKPDVTGAANMTVSSGYHTETIRIYVGDPNKSKVRVNGTVSLFVGMTQELPAEATARAWTARSMNTDLVTVSPTNGVAGTPVTLRGVSASAMTVDGRATSETTVTVDTDDTIYIYTVTVANPTTQSTDLGVINVGQTITMDIPPTMFDGPVRSITPLDNNLTVECNFDAANQRNVITGKQEGKTTLVVKTDTKTYYLQVSVRTAHIDKHIQLAIGADGTDLTYSYTFDRLEDMHPDYVGAYNVITNADGSIRYQAKNAANYSVLREGNKVTFIPGNYEQLDDTRNTVVFLGQVDGLAYTTELHYWVKVVQAPEDERVLQKDGKPGFISYKGTDDVHVDPATGDLILVFTNVNEDATITVPAPWNVKMDVLAIGGGGSGGSTVRYGQGGGGGGAGGFSLISNRVLTAGTFGVVVGRGADNADVAGQPGTNGDPSALTNAFGRAIVSAKGGGGGGAMSSADPEAINGMPGGSGGGAAWNNRSAGTGGAVADDAKGQGFSGGTPQMQGAGGGGGGAGGAGGSTGSAGAGGAGRVSDISGETVVYAVGGAGGHNDQQHAGAAGAGPGYGGEGGSGAQGGNGADGIVIVRIKDIYRNIKVPIPGPEDVKVSLADGEAGTEVLVETKMVTPRFVWGEWASNEMACVAFEYEGKEFRSSTDAKPHNWNDAVASVTGQTSVNCYEGFNLVGDPVKEGVGYYSFTIRLKEGYSWEDGLGADTYGDTSPKVYRWAVVESEDVVTAAINIHKTVEWTGVSNATVKVTTYTSPEMSGGHTPEVLFIGGLCSFHNLAGGTVHDAINAIAQNANVDWYLYNNPGKTKPAVKDASGRVEKGGTCTWTPEAALESDNHQVLKAFLQNIYDNVANNANGRTYDYIVIEFDGSRIGNYYDDSITALPSDIENAVAEALAPFYASDSVIWIVDDWGESRSGYYPWNPTEGENAYYRPTSFYSAQNSQKELTAVAWNATVALLDPKNHKDSSSGWTTANKTTFEEYWWVNSDKGGSTTHTRSSTSCWVADKNTNQVHYSESDTVAEYLRNAIKVKPYNLNLRDKIKHGDSGLSVTGVVIQACLKGEGVNPSTNSADWTDLMMYHVDTDTFEWMDKTHATGIEGGYMTVNMASNIVDAVISNVDFTVWTRVNIGVVDDGHFRTSEDAYYNESTGKWEKNPNDGTAFAEMLDNLGNGLNIEGEAETETPWSFDSFTIRTIVENGRAFVQGRNLQVLEIGENNNCSVYYRGNGGCRLVSVVVDGEPVSIDTFQSSYVFRDVMADHEIRIRYEPYITAVDSSPVTNVYDGAIHLYDVFVTTNELSGVATDVSDVEVRYAPLEILEDETKATNDVYWLNADAFMTTYGTNVPQWVASEYTDVGDHEFAYRVYAKQPGYGEDRISDGWVWVQLGNDETDHSVILPCPLTVRPNDSTLIYSTNNLPHIGFSFGGFVGDEDLAAIGLEEITNGWYVTSTYRKGMGMGLYPTWVRDVAHEELWNGDSTYVITNNPTIVAAEGLYNFGNYYLVTAENGQAVEKLPLEIGDVPQMPGLSPDSAYSATGVNPAEKLYDGVPTNLTVHVTSWNPSNDCEMVLGQDYTITYVALPDGADPTVPPDFSTGTATNPTRTHAGTTVVWYLVEPQGIMTNNFFAASNYNYVVVNPRKLVLESGTETWKFNGIEHELDQVWEVEGEGDGLAPGDTLIAHTTNTILHVGSKPNAFEWNIAIGDTAFTGSAEDDYDVETRFGQLTVTPKGMEVGGVSQDPDDYSDDDPNFPGLHFNSGVEDVNRQYDGTGTNIVVTVNVPEDASRFKIYYTTNMTGEVEWSETNPVFTNACDQAVWYRIEAVGDWAKDYLWVTNFARVIITPRTATVTANNAETSVGATEQPPYTATVAGDFAAKDVGHEYELIHWTLITCTNFAECVKAEGTYPGVIVPTGVATQGNYAVTYYPGNLVVVAKPLVYSLWITDHADAGDGMVHLQFEPMFSKPVDSLSTWMQEASTAGRIWVFFGDTPADAEKVTTADAAHAVQATLRAANPVDEATGRVWITVNCPGVYKAARIVIFNE